MWHCGFFLNFYTKVNMFLDHIKVYFFFFLLAYVKKIICPIATVISLSSQWQVQVHIWRRQRSLWARSLRILRDFFLPSYWDGIILVHQLLHSGKLILQHINAKKNPHHHEKKHLTSVRCIKVGLYQKWNTGESICKMMVFIYCFLTLKSSVNFFSNTKQLLSTPWISVCILHCNSESDYEMWRWAENLPKMFLMWQVLIYTSTFCPQTLKNWLTVFETLLSVAVCRTTFSGITLVKST